MPVIWGHVESVVNRRNVPPSVVVSTRSPFGKLRIECVVGVDTRMARGFERLSVEEIRPGEFVVATLKEHAGWMEAERIDVIIFQIDSAIEFREEQIPTDTSDRVT